MPESHPKKRRISFLRILVPVTIVGMVLLASGAWLPLPAGWDGVTLCYPIVGPVQRLSQSLSDTARARVKVHEDSHRDQCLEDGALRHYATLATRSGRLAAEVAADCAEARYEVALGRPAYLEHERIVDELHYGDPWLRKRPDSLVRAEIREICPELAAAAAGPPPWAASLGGAKADSVS